MGHTYIVWGEYQKQTTLTQSRNRTEHNTQISDTGYHKKGNEMENKQRDSIDTKQRNEITRNQRQNR